MNKYDGRQLYAKLRICGHFKIVEKLYSDWIRTNSCLVGFACEVVGLKSPEKFDKILDFIAQHELPLEVFDYPTHAKKFKIKIIK